MSQVILSKTRFGVNRYSQCVAKIDFTFHSDIPKIMKYKRLSRSDVDLGGELKYDFVDDNKVLRTDGATLRFATVML